MWFRRLRPYVILVTIGMHFGITWTMNIVFIAFEMQLFLTGFPWAEWAAMVKHRIYPSTAVKEG
jgi:hypothetical protein